ncbi:MAG TPA: pentapeptide repeat-containing protein [Rectinema sp.]|jgi:uncharacterized protein YjbI with pentapeptide repeats|nr:pentapeptide repeat-containing protein [Spirochaetia bacterium]NLH90587.1 hypothetical protein [Treponema sp.]OQC75140.1 MAG: hypothetical protein BWX44_00214 [Spirochaetes bacterium ADurb.Bin001]HNV35494.1 pentapeptide repeat-containing protein [Rectinema sp.]HOC26612.1 pentapeptide repeat-containing protein [Rectinema sp.]
MFKVSACSIEDCSLPAFSLENLCYYHLQDYPERMKKAMQELQSKNILLNRVFDNAFLMGLDFSRYRFVGCSFRNARIQHSLFTGASFHLCFFDSSSFFSCDLSGADVDFCSFGKCSFMDCSFENSELIQSCFNGSVIVDCTFAGSNLYNSRFIMCDMNTVNIDNCDFKRAFYIPSKEQNVSFSRSNIAEAVRDLEHLYL